jgi:DNA-binding FadR family transcriptional regulator
MFKRRTDTVIEDLLAATCGLHAEMRQRHVYAQALQGLVRLAKVEQLLEMRMDVERAAGSMACVSRKRQTRAILRKIGMDVRSRQRELEFGQQYPERKGGQD